MSKAAESKGNKQDVSCTVILPHKLVFSALLMTFFAKQFIHSIKRDTKQYRKQIITYF